MFIALKKNWNQDFWYNPARHCKCQTAKVKAGKTGTLKSMQMYLYEKKLSKGIRFNMDIPSKGMFNTKVNGPGKIA
jgi:uncharacterized protein